MLLNALLLQAIAASLVFAGDAPRSNKRARRTVQDIDDLPEVPIAAPTVPLDPVAAGILASLMTGTTVFPVAPTGVLSSIPASLVPTATLVARQLTELPSLPLPEIPGVSTDILASLAMPTSPAGLLSVLPISLLPIPTSVLAILPRQLPTALPTPPIVGDLPIPVIPTDLPAFLPIPSGLPALTDVPALLTVVPTPSDLPALPIRRRQLGDLTSALPIPADGAIPQLPTLPVSLPITLPTAIPTGIPAIPSVPVVAGLLSDVASATAIASPIATIL